MKHVQAPLAAAEEWRVSWTGEEGLAPNPRDMVEILRVNPISVLEGIYPLPPMAAPLSVGLSCAEIKISVGISASPESFLSTAPAASREVAALSCRSFRVRSPGLLGNVAISAFASRVLLWQDRPWSAAAWFTAHNPHLRPHHVAAAALVARGTFHSGRAAICLRQQKLTTKRDGNKIAVKTGMIIWFNAVVMEEDNFRRINSLSQSLELPQRSMAGP